MMTPKRVSGEHHAARPSGEVEIPNDGNSTRREIVEMMNAFEGRITSSVKENLAAVNNVPRQNSTGIIFSIVGLAITVAIATLINLAYFAHTFGELEQKVNDNSVIIQKLQEQQERDKTIITQEAQLLSDLQKEVERYCGLPLKGKP